MSIAVVLEFRSQTFDVTTGRIPLRNMPIGVPPLQEHEVFLSHWHWIMACWAGKVFNMFWTLSSSHSLLFTLFIVTSKTLNSFEIFFSLSWSTSSTVSSVISSLSQAQSMDDHWCSVKCFTRQATVAVLHPPAWWEWEAYRLKIAKFYGIHKSSKVGKSPYLPSKSIKERIRKCGIHGNRWSLSSPAKRLC